MKEVSKDDLVLNCANPEGEAGLQTLERMNISHGELTKWGLSHIEINRDDQLLDVGCGGGMALYRAAKCNPCGRCYGLDISELSLREAEKVNAEDVKNGRMIFSRGSALDLPYPDRSMDVVISVESYYFWPDPQAGIKEIARVLKEGGTLLIVLEYNADMEKDDSYYHNQELLHMTVPSDRDLKLEFKAAGFCDIRTDIKDPWICAVGKWS